MRTGRISSRTRCCCSCNSGASGVVFGFIGYLLSRPAFDRKLWLMPVTLIVAATYGAVLWASIMPRSGISWSAHFFGFAGGVLATRLRTPPALRLDHHLRISPPPFAVDGVFDLHVLLHPHP